MFDGNGVDDESEDGISNDDRSNSDAVLDAVDAGRTLAVVDLDDVAVVGAAVFVRVDDFVRCCFVSSSSELDESSEDDDEEDSLSDGAMGVKAGAEEKSAQSSAAADVTIGAGALSACFGGRFFFTADDEVELDGAMADEEEELGLAE